MTRAGLAAAHLLDGTRGIAEIRRTLCASGAAGRDGELAALVDLLRARGFLAYDPAADGEFAAGVAACATDASAATKAFLRAVARDPDHLGALRELALVALGRGDDLLARRVARRLACFAGNQAARHLRRTLERWGAGTRLAVERRGPVTVLAARGGSATAAHRVLDDAHELIPTLARLLGVELPGEIVLDVTGERAAVPVTMVADADPYTAVRIAQPTYSRSILCHELVHVLATSDSSWLSEGLAVWAQRAVAPGACFPDDAPLAADHVACGSPARSAAGAACGSLAELLRSPQEDCGTFRLAPRLGRDGYLAAADFVDFLARAGGVGGLRRFFTACQPGRDHASLGVACAEIGFASLGDLEDAWRSAR